MQPGSVLRELTPPILWRLLKRARASLARNSSPAQPAVQWEYVPQGWAYAAAHPEVRGWNVTDILEVHRRSWPAFRAMVQGSGPMGTTQESALASPADLGVHNTYMAFAYVAALAARGGTSLSMLDWGGGDGHYYLLTQALLPGVQVEYHCKDVSVLAEYGAQLFPDQHFYTDESCLERTYDLVLASSSLHYTEDWSRLLCGLARAAASYLYVTRLPVISRAPSFVFVQRPYVHGYNTEYLGWCLNRAEFLAAAQNCGLTLMREMLIGEQPAILNAPEQCQYRGFLFRPSAEREHEVS